MGDVIGGLTDIFGGTSAASRAAGAAGDAADMAALQNQMAQYSTWARQKPWWEAGKASINELGKLMGPGGQLYNTNFTANDFLANQDPGYQWRVQQGQNALASQAAAGGNYGSGNMGVALTNYGQNAASDEYQAAYNRFMNGQNMLYNRLAGISGTGQVAANNLMSLNALGQNAAQYSGNAGMMGAQAYGNAMYNSMQGAYNMMAGGMGSKYGIGNILSNMFGGGGGYGGGEYYGADYMGSGGEYTGWADYMGGL